MSRWIGLLLIATCCLGCTSTANVESEREALKESRSRVGRVCEGYGQVHVLLLG
jgi:hypothetical protein